MVLYRTYQTIESFYSSYIKTDKIEMRITRTQ
jgi:hypothetical protein